MTDDREWVADLTGGRVVRSCGARSGEVGRESQATPDKEAVVLQFMTQEWFDAVGQRLGEDETAKLSFADIELRVQQIATGGPIGDIKHYLKVDHGDFEIGCGELADPDVTLTASYEDARAIHTGDLDAMSAFSSGRMLVQGNLAVLMQHQAAMMQLTAAMESLRDQTKY